MSKSALFNRSRMTACAESPVISTGSDNGCDANLAGLEYSARLTCEACGTAVKASGRRFCSHACYAQSLRRSIRLRFWTKVNKNGPLPSDVSLGPCWIWTAARIKGYGQIIGVLDGVRRPLYAHRVAWELSKSAIPVGLSVLHKCDVPLCVNPNHLFLGSQQDNLGDARAKGRLDERRPRTSRLTYEQRLEIYRARQYRGVCVDLSREYGITVGSIKNIRAGRFARMPETARKAS